MNPELGAGIPSLPMILSLDRTLERYVGPVLNLYRNEQGEPYLDLWLDREAGRDQWLLFRVSENQLVRFEDRALTLRAVLASAPEGYGFVRRLNGGEIERVSVLSLAELPEPYIPTAKSYHEPEEGNAGERRQRVLLDGKWTFDGLRQLQMKYEQIYAFLGAFGVLGKNLEPGHFVVNPKLKLEPQLFAAGWNYKVAYDKLTTTLGPDSRVEMAAVQLASPGYIVFNVEPEIASAVRHLAAKIPTQRKALAKKYRAAHALVLELGRSLEVKAVPGQKRGWDLTREDSADLSGLKSSTRKAVKEFAGSLVCISYDYVEERTGSVYVAGELVLTTYRRLLELLSFANGDGPKGELVGIRNLKERDQED